MKAKFGFSIIFSFAVLFLSACTIDMGMLVNPDGSGSLGVTYKLTAEDINTLVEDGSVSRDQICEQLGEDNEDFTFIQEEHNEEIWCIGTRPVNSLSEMKTEMQGDGFQINTLEIVGNQFTFDADVRLDSGSQDVLAFTFSVSAPGEVIEHNGDEINGNTVTWNLAGTKNLHLESHVNDLGNGDGQNQPSDVPMASVAEIAYVGEDGNIWIVEDNGANAHPITQSGQDSSPAWSVDGGKLYFLRNVEQDGLLIEYDFLTESEKVLAKQITGLSPAAATSDGKRLLVAKSGVCISILYLENGNLEDIYCKEAAANDPYPMGFDAPTFSPSETEIAVALTGGFESAAVSFYSTSGDEIEKRACCFSPQYFPDGNFLMTEISGYFASFMFDSADKGGIYRYDLQTGEYTPLLLADFIARPHLSADGQRIIYERKENLQEKNNPLEILEISTGGISEVARGSQPAWRPLKSVEPPSQGWIAYIGEDGNMWLVQPDGSQAKQLTADASETTKYESPKWSHDGKWLAFIRQDRNDESSSQTLQVIRSSGFELVVSKIETAGGLSWMPDSQHLIFDQQAIYEMDDFGCKTQLKEPYGLYILDIGTTGTELLVSPIEQQPLFSPLVSPGDDGNVILRFDQMPTMYNSRPYYVTPLEKGNVAHPLENSWKSCDWSNDGSTIACDTWSETCSSDDGASCPVTLYDPSGTIRAQLPMEVGLYDLNPSWSPDDQYIAVEATDGYFFADGGCVGGSGPSVYGEKQYVDIVSVSDRTRRHLTSGIFNDWSPDGKWILVSVNASEKRDNITHFYNSIYKVDVKTGDTSLVIANGYSPVWQPVLVSRPSIPASPSLLAITDLIAKPGIQVGEFILEWTTPSSDEQSISSSATFEFRYSDQPITEESWQEASVIPTTSMQPLAGTKQSWLAKSLPTHQQLFFAAKIMDNYGQASGISNIAWVIDTGFRPNVDGFQFGNDDSDWNTLMLADQDFTLEDMRVMLGDTAVCSSAAEGQCQAYLAAQFWHSWILATNMGGRSYGMAASAQLLFAGQAFISSNFQGNAPNAHALDFDSIRRLITYQTIMQWVDPVLGYMNQAMAETPAHIVAELQQTMAYSIPSPAVLVMTQGVKGHSLTPYALEDRGGDITWIHVYDSNYPDDAERIVKVNRKTNEWAYEMGGTWGTWDQSQFRLGLIPLSLHQVTSQAPWLPESRQIWFSGAGNLLITDDNGQQMGYQDGQYVNTLPGGQFHPVLEISGASEPIYTLPPEGEIRISIYGEATAGFAAIAQFGRKNVASVDGFLVTPKSHDLLVISPDGSKITYMATESKSLTLTLTLDSEGISYQYQVQNADIGPGETISLQSDTATGRLIFSNDRAYGGNYDLMIRRLTPNGEESGVYRNITIANGATHTFDLFTWATDLPILLSIDHDSDGQFDAQTRWSAQGEIKDRLAWLNYPYGVIGGCSLSIFGLILFVVGVIGVSRWRAK